MGSQSPTWLNDWTESINRTDLSRGLRKVYFIWFIFKVRVKLKSQLSGWSWWSYQMKIDSALQAQVSGEQWKEWEKWGLKKMQRPNNGVSVCSGCCTECHGRALKQQKCIFSSFSKLEVQHQDACMVRVWWKSFLVACQWPPCAHVDLALCLLNYEPPFWALLTLIFSSKPCLQVHWGLGLQNIISRAGNLAPSKWRALCATKVFFFFHSVLRMCLRLFCAGVISWSFERALCLQTGWSEKGRWSSIRRNWSVSGQKEGTAA